MQEHDAVIDLHHCRQEGTIQHVDQNNRTATDHGGETIVPTQFNFDKRTDKVMGTCGVHANPIESDLGDTKVSDSTNILRSEYI